MIVSFFNVCPLTVRAFCLEDIARSGKDSDVYAIGERKTTQPWLWPVCRLPSLHFENL